MPMSHEKEQQTTVTAINTVDGAWNVSTHQAPFSTNKRRNMEGKVLTRLIRSSFPGWSDILIHMEQIAGIIGCFDLCQ